MSAQMIASLATGLSFSCLYPSSKTGQPETRNGTIEMVGDSYLKLKLVDGSYRSLSFNKIVNPQIGG